MSGRPKKRTIIGWFQLSVGSEDLNNRTLWIHPKDQKLFLSDYDICDIMTHREQIQTGLVAHVWGRPVVTSRLVPRQCVLWCFNLEVTMVPETAISNGLRIQFNRWHWPVLEEIAELWPTLPLDLQDRTQPRPKILSGLARKLLVQTCDGETYIQPTNRARSVLERYGLIERVGLDRFIATPKGHKVTKIYPTVWQRLV